MKLWTPSKVNMKVGQFTVGNDHLLDMKLVMFDCQGSIAHVKMLKKAGILSAAECVKLVKELNAIQVLAEKGLFTIAQEQEDCHTAIENHLTKKLGSVGKKVHTLRSRNDQVLTALRLYYRSELAQVSLLISSLIKSLSEFGKANKEVKLPGYTHMRKAMPSSFSLWTGAFKDAMNDNQKYLSAVAGIIDQSPLGSGAGYGLPVHVDRQYTAKLLGFSKVQQNPLYVQNSRGKFESCILHCLGLVMFDLNKMASDLLLFSMPELGFVELSPEFCTGSSLMPHKKNHDVLELVRAKYHQVMGEEFQVKSMTSNLISGYNRDVQLTKG